jgi:hypothetical protein
MKREVLRLDGAVVQGGAVLGTVDREGLGPERSGFEADEEEKEESSRSGADERRASSDQTARRTWIAAGTAGQKSKHSESSTK